MFSYLNHFKSLFALVSPQPEQPLHPQPQEPPLFLSLRIFLIINVTIPIMTSDITIVPILSVIRFIFYLYFVFAFCFRFSLFAFKLFAFAFRFFAYLSFFACIFFFAYLASALAFIAKSSPSSFASLYFLIKSIYIM